MNEIRIGHGYDVHRLVEDRRFILGGVEIPSEKGLLGHSDADVLVHAIMDSLLGSMALGDIGKHFPDTDESFKGASSINLLIRVKKILEEHSARVINVDSTVILESPKLRPYIDLMRTNIAFALGVDVSRISVKATTEEHLGFTGRGEGVSAHAVSLVEIVK